MSNLDSAQSTTLQERTTIDSVSTYSPKAKKVQNSQIPLSRTTRFILFLIMISLEGSMNISSGLLSSASKSIKSSLNLNDKQFGMFGTANGLGRMLGSSIFIALNQRVNRKFLLILFCVLKGIFLISYKLTDNSVFLIILRGCIGFVHMTPSIYVQVWIDQYGIRKYKNAQMACIQLVQPGGKCVGYLLNVLLGEVNWQLGFLLEGCYIIFLSCIFLFVKGMYFSRTLFVKKELDLLQISKFASNANNKALKLKGNKHNRDTVFEEIFEIKIEDLQQNSKKTVLQNHLRDVKLLAANSIFLMGIISRCILYGINTGFLFWIADYMRNVLFVKNFSVIFISYTFICLTGPAGGVLGNMFFKKCIGNYEGRKASWSLLGLHFISCLFAVGLCCMNNIISFVCLTVFYFVFNSSALALLQGILISSVEQRLAATGFSWANVVTQIFTSGPAPIFYGVINDKYKSKYPKLALIGLMGMLFIALPFLIIMALLRDKKIKEEKMKIIKSLINVNDKNEELIEKEMDYLSDYDSYEDSAAEDEEPKVGSDENKSNNKSIEEIIEVNEEANE